MDGSPIVGELEYILMVDGVDFLNFPGTLNQDGKYYEDTANMNLPDGMFSITLSAFYVDEPVLRSQPSNPKEIIMGVTNPNPPLDLGAG